VARRAALYARISEDKTGKAHGVQRQLQDARNLAKAKGWAVAGEYVDNDRSAYDGKPRPEYERLLHDIRGGHVDAVVAYAPDRLVRRLVELERLIALCEAHDVTIATVAGEYDLSSPVGRMVARLLGSVAMAEVEVKGARQKRANLQRAQTGDVRWTRRPYGYDRRNGRIVKVPTEAKHVRRVAEAVLDGRSLRSQVDRLNKAQVPTSMGAAWTVTTLRRILMNPRYAGIAMYDGKEIGDGKWPAILSRDEHRALVSLLGNPARRLAPSTATKYLLSGLAICGRCGQKLFAAPMGKPGAYYLAYKCFTKPHLSRRLDWVDRLVVGAVIGRVTEPDAAEALLPATPDVTAARKEADRLRVQLDELAALFVEGAVTASGLRQASARLNAKLAEQEAVIASSHAGRVLAPLLGAVDAREVWARLDLQQQRAVIDTLMTVTILPSGRGLHRHGFDPSSVEIRWKVS
jgi:site-specific DNA recombinase